MALGAVTVVGAEGTRSRIGATEAVHAADLALGAARVIAAREAAAFDAVLTVGAHVGALALGRRDAEAAVARGAARTLAVNAEVDAATVNACASGAALVVELAAGVRSETLAFDAELAFRALAVIEADARVVDTHAAVVTPLAGVAVASSGALGAGDALTIFTTLTRGAVRVRDTAAHRRVDALAGRDVADEVTRTLTVANAADVFRNTDAVFTDQASRAVAIEVANAAAPDALGGRGRTIVTVGPNRAARENEAQGKKKEEGVLEHAASQYCEVRATSSCRQNQEKSRKSPVIPWPRPNRRGRKGTISVDP